MLYHLGNIDVEVEHKILKVPGSQNHKQFKGANPHCYMYMYTCITLTYYTVVIPHLGYLSADNRSTLSHYHHTRVQPFQSHTPHTGACGNIT